MIALIMGRTYGSILCCFPFNGLKSVATARLRLIQLTKSDIEIPKSEIKTIFARMILHPNISEQFDGATKRMEIDEVTETIFVEVRNSEEKKVYFGAINLSSGETFFRGLSTDERWLTGIEAAYNGVLLLHFYQSESGPAHKGLLAVDAFTGKTLWSNFAYSFDHLSVNGPVLYDARIQPRKLFLADIKTGATTRIYEPSVYKRLGNNIVLPDVKTPEFLAPGLLPVHAFGNMIH